MGHRIIIVYFVYINHPSNWTGIIRGQIEDIKASNILKISDLYVCISGQQEHSHKVSSLIDTLLVEEKKESHVEYCYTNDNLYEYPGIHQIYLLSQTNQDKLFIYFHTKEMSRCTSPQQRPHLNMILTRTLFWNYKKVVNIFDTQPNINKIGLFPASYGWIWFNFFWVRGSYLIQCQPPLITTRRHHYEDWLGSSHQPSLHDGYSLYSDRISEYNPNQAVSNLCDMMSHIDYLIINNPIKKITYGYNHHLIDITSKFKQLLETEHYIHIGNHLTGHDPHYGVIKILKIRLVNGLVFEFKEGRHVLISDDTFYTS